MAVNKKSGFSLAPITLSEPIKSTDGFTNLVDSPVVEAGIMKAVEGSDAVADEHPQTKNKVPAEGGQIVQSKSAYLNEAKTEQVPKEDVLHGEKSGKSAEKTSLTEGELLRILDADSLDEIYELSDVLRASSLKLYAALVRLADSRGRTRVKNHELMSKSGIKGIATLYKQERWLMDLKLLEKKAKPGPHDGSSYIVHKLENLPLPAEIYEKFDEYLSGLK